MIAKPDPIECNKLWYAVHTRSRHEKTVGRLLEAHRIERFVPLVKVLSQWADRKKWVEKPYFPGYIFARIREDEMPEVRAARGVVGLVGAEPFRPTSVPDREIESIRLLVENHVPVDPYPYLKPGQTVCVRRGPLRGVEGTLVKKAKKHYLVVSVNLLGRSVIAEVPAECVQGL